MKLYAKFPPDTLVDPNINQNTNTPIVKEIYWHFVEKNHLFILQVVGIVFAIL